MPPALNPLYRLMRWRSEMRNSEKLYGAIVAQARLPVFYRDLGIPDTLEGRFALLSLHLFAVLHRLKGASPEGLALAQELVDQFTQDMETVLREIGVGDLSIPKKMRGLAASSAGLLEDYEAAFATDEASFAAAIAAALPPESGTAELSSKALASYLKRCVTQLERQPLASLRAGALDFAEIGRPNDESAEDQGLGPGDHALAADKDRPRR